MPDINWGLAATGVQYPDLGKTLSQYATLQMSQAHAGLYSLEAAKQAMTIHGLQAYQQRLASGEPAEKAVDALSFNPELQKSALGAAKDQRDLLGDKKFGQTHNPDDIPNPTTRADLMLKGSEIGLNAAKRTGEELANTGKRMGLVAQTAQSMPGLIGSLPTSQPQRDPFNQPQAPPQEDPQIVAARASVAGGVANNLATGTVQPGQANAAWSHAIDGMLKNGLITRQQAEQWRTEGYSPARIKQLMDQGLNPEQYQIASGQQEYNQGIAKNDVKDDALRRQQPQQEAQQTATGTGAGQNATKLDAINKRIAYYEELQKTSGNNDAGVVKQLSDARIEKVKLQGGSNADEIQRYLADRAALTPPATPGNPASAQPPSTTAPAAAPAAQAGPGQTQMMTDAQREQAVMSNIAKAAAGVPQGPDRDAMVGATLTRALQAGAISDQTYGKFAPRGGANISDDDIKAMTPKPAAQQSLTSVLSPANQPVAPAGQPKPPNANDVWQSPAQIKEGEAAAKDLGEMPGKLKADADASKTQNAYVNSLMQHSHSFQMGPWANVKYDAQLWLKTLANEMGVKDTQYDKPLADFESFRKSAMQLIRTAVRETSSRAAVQEFNMIATATPSTDMSHGGLENMAAQIKGINNYAIMKQQYSEAYDKEHGGLKGFSTEWNRNVSADAYMFHELTPAQQKETVANMRKENGGEARANELFRQINWIKAHGLEPQS